MMQLGLSINYESKNLIYVTKIKFGTYDTPLKNFT